MLKEDIKKYVNRKVISMSELRSLQCMKLMNNSELDMVNSILSEMKSNGNDKGKVLLKQIDGVGPLVSTEEVQMSNYMDAS
jgi:hypothetical protein